MKIGAHSVISFDLHFYNEEDVSIEITAILTRELPLILRVGLFLICLYRE